MKITRVVSVLNRRLDVQILKRENCLDMDESIASHSVETVIDKPHQSLKRSRSSSHSNSSDSNATSLEDSPFLKMLSDDLDALRSPKNKYVHRSSSKHEKNKTKDEPVKDCFSYYSSRMKDESPVLAHEISSDEAPLKIELKSDLEDGELVEDTLESEKINSKKKKKHRKSNKGKNGNTPDMSALTGRSTDHDVSHKPNLMKSRCGQESENTDTEGISFISTRGSGAYHEQESSSSDKVDFPLIKAFVEKCMPLSLEEGEIMSPRINGESSSSDELVFAGNRGMPLHAKTDKSVPFQRTIDPREPHMSMLNAQSTRRFIQDSSTSNIAESVINKMLQNIYSTNVNTQPNLQTYLTGFSRSVVESVGGSTQNHSPGQNFPRQQPHSHPTSEQSSGQRTNQQSYLVPNIPPFVMQYQQSHSTQQRPPLVHRPTFLADGNQAFPHSTVRPRLGHCSSQTRSFTSDLSYRLTSPDISRGGWQSFRMQQPQVDALDKHHQSSLHQSSKWTKHMAPATGSAHMIPEVSSKLRKWDQLKQVSSTHGGMEFTLMTYNILAQDYLEQNIHLYSRCEQKDLEWNNRGPALMVQIIAHNADIVCLQEVQEDHWLQDMKDPLEKHGYVSVYKSKEGGKPDGCAVLYKRDKFHKIKFVPVEFKKGGILDRDNIGIILVLKPIPPRGCTITVPKICVATTHLLFNPKRGDVKLAQMMVLLAEIDKHACIDEDFSCRPSKEASRNSSACSSSKAENQSSDDPDGHKSKSTYCPIIFCGDLNAEPLSDMYKFITSGYLKYEKCISKLLCGQREGQTDTWSPELGKELLPRSVDITESCQYSHVVRNRYKSESPPDRKLRKNSGKVFHEMNFKSVYNHFIKDRRGHKLTEITSQHECVSATVDYIFYSCSRKHALVEPLVLLSRYRLLTTKDTYKIGYLPNSTFPSDHFCLMAKFLLN